MNKINKKKFLMLILGFVLSSVLIIGTIAYEKKMFSKKNDFILGIVEPKVIETIDLTNNIKEDIYITNNGNVPIYVRIATLYYFVNSEGMIIKDIPAKDVNYSIIFSSSQNWIKAKDGYYYYKLMLQPNESTDMFIEKCIEINKTSEKKFTMDIAVQGIQAIPPKAVEEVWGISVVDENLIIE